MKIIFTSSLTRVKLITCNVIFHRKKKKCQRSDFFLTGYKKKQNEEKSIQISTLPSQMWVPMQVIGIPPRPARNSVIKRTTLELYIFHDEKKKEKKAFYVKKNLNLMSFIFFF